LAMGGLRIWDGHGRLPSNSPKAGKVSRAAWLRMLYYEQP
jgi:hypothetical protein